MADSEERTLTIRSKGQRAPAAPSKKERAPAAPPKKARTPAVPSKKGRTPAARSKEEGAPAERAKRAPQNHRTIDRVTRILEEVVYNPGMTFAELVRALDAAKSSVHGFISGLLAKGWLYQEQHRFYLGPAVYGLTLASGHIRAGLVTHEDLVALEKETGVAAFLGVQAGDHLIYIAEAGSDHVTGFEARSNIRRTLLITAGGKALLAERPEAERESYLRRRSAEDRDLVDRFLEEYERDQADADRDQRSPGPICDRDDRAQSVRRGGGVDYARWARARSAAPREEAEPDPASARRLLDGTIR